MLPSLEVISRRRKELGLTQSVLARMAGVSQGYIAKIEARRLNPSYLKVRSILEALDSFEIEDEASAAEVMNRELVTVETTTHVKRAVEVMRKNGFSQLPVMEEGLIVGSIDERTMLEHLVDNKDSKPETRVEEVMAESFPQVGEETPLNLVTTLLKVYPAVLVQKAGEVTGIITKSDVLSHIT